MVALGVSQGLWEWEGEMGQDITVGLIRPAAAPKYCELLSLAA